ncbi:MAG: 4-amino-4-deoxy-L-arabinose transferase-like glycosyltransferase [Candidatus Promineifilaceae bacterium]
MWNSLEIKNQNLKDSLNPRWFAWGLLFITVMGVYMRFPGLFANRFSADEALFGMWARYIATWRDPFLLNVPTPVDKPPLLFYLQALFYPLQGPVEWAARLPNFFASIVLIPLVGRMAFQMTNKNQKRAWLAAAIVAFSPLAIQFSATAFTDPLLTFFVTVALWCAIRPQKSSSLIYSSGLWLGIALLVKYQAVLFLPLVWLFEWGKFAPNRLNQISQIRQIPKKDIIRWLLHFTGCIGLLLLWDALSGGGIDLVSQQTSAYGGFSFIPLALFLPRFWAWMKLFLYVPGWGFALICALSFIIFFDWKRKCDLGYFSRIIVFVFSYMLLHIMLQSLLEPRYALPLVPIFALGVANLPLRRPEWLSKPAWAWIRTDDDIKQGIQLLIVVVVCAIFLVQAMPARMGNYPVGGRPGNDEGAAAIAQTILEQPYGTVLYDHWYSWHWRYHFFYKGVYVEWFDQTEELLENLEAFYDPAAEDKRYLALRVDDRFAEEIVSALDAAGYRLEPVAHEGRIELYVISQTK